jgi:protein-tyrosine phosphatase
MQAVIKVLFVCSGNICRSPMAEAVFQDQVNKAGLSRRFVIDSAGTGPWHVGERAHSGTLSILRRNGIDYKGRARQITREDLNTYDYVLVMDDSNMASLARLAQGTTAEVAMFLRFANAAGTVTSTEVPDPYYSDNFDYVYNMVLRGSQALLAYLRAQHNL